MIGPISLRLVLACAWDGLRRSLTWRDAVLAFVLVGAAVHACIGGAW